jgi:penicillin-binding protein 2
MVSPVINNDGRRRVALTILGVLMVVLFIGLFRLQVIEHAELSRRSRENRMHIQIIAARRGLVTDRHGEIIIDNRPSFTVSIVKVEADSTTVPNLAELLEIPQKEVKRRLKKNLISPYQPAPIARDVDFAKIAIAEEQSYRFPGVEVQLEEVRRYAEGLGSEAFTGYVGEVSPEERKKAPRGKYRLGSVIGKKGIERQYDELLRGEDGRQFIEATAAGQTLGPMEGQPPKLPVPGVNLELTIDNHLQRTCVALKDTFCCGAIVAMDPRNGEVLAMTSWPSYDANMFSRVIPDSAWRRISSNPHHPLLNRPLDGRYPPGSTTKLVTIGAALEEGLINANTTLKPCYGGYQFGNRYFRCWLERGHGHTTPATSLEQSCDVYLYQVGLKLGIDLLAEYYGKCGFGRRTGIDLPVEAEGLNPNSDWYDRQYGENKWSRGLVLNNSIGQGEILSTPLQLAQFFCGVANDGEVYRPHMVRRKIYPDGRVETVQPELSFKLPFRPSTLELLQEGYRLVVEGEHGTARRLRNNEYSIGGKTGTAQNPHGENHSWFVGVAPLEDPRIVVAAIVENSGHGSEVAAPMVGEIIKAYMHKRVLGEGIASAGEEAP